MQVNKRPPFGKHRKVWETYYNSCLLPGVEIHHIDGNYNNNEITNLMPVTIEEHFLIHYSQQDYPACKAILLRMESNPILMAECSSIIQQQKWKDGTHNFQKIPKEKRLQISRAVGAMTRDMKIGIHKINSDPLLVKENARNGGKAAWAKKAGFLNPAKSGSNYVKNTKWWINMTTKERKRSLESPGVTWKRGMYL